MAWPRSSVEAETAEPVLMVALLLFLAYMLSPSECLPNAVN